MTLLRTFCFNNGTWALGYDECKVRCRQHNVKVGAQRVCRCRMVAWHNSSLQNLALYALRATPLVGTVITFPPK